MQVVRLFKVGLAAMALLVGGCTYSHEIHLSLESGKLVFVFDDGKPVAFTRLAIVELSSETPTVWQLESLEYNGRDIGKLVYGTVPTGTKQISSAKLLRVGQLYRAELSTIDGGGSQEFVISPDAANGQSDEAKIVRK
ncbi:hypothetical protein WSK_2887 [Novosphingobium sp. Rr 2-17]|uniref:hypothetical protein n=1 Tax=Novosphingobium sp. Rr 2-17 TaxID=555793 RepID=UPI0002699EEB|nr:hypothetical protein [Novosphingobium sp. Rr 2-17]EIZ78443.1 hypothetical protein WSK_2887 [Novosphingobium sp. Rr 2-17]